MQRSSVLINTACFPPRQVLWQQSKDSLKAGQGSLSKVPLSPNNGTNSVLTWTLLQEVPGTRQCWENYPADKTWGEETPSKVWGCSPTPAVGAQPHCRAGMWLQRRGSTCLPAPRAGVCSEQGGIQGKNHPETPWGCSSPGAGFLGGCQVPALSSQSSMPAFGRGCLVPPCPNPLTRCRGVGPICARGCRMSPRGQDTAGCRTTVDARPMH